MRVIFFTALTQKNLSKKKSTLPLCGDNSISFNQIEIFVKDHNKVNSKIINIKDIKQLPTIIKKSNSRY